MNDKLQRGCGVMAVVAWLATGCDSDEDGNAKRMTVGAQGGTITLDSGATVTVPPGALDGDVEIGVEWVTDPASVAALPAFASGAFDGALVLTPHGTEFELPVTVTVPTTIATDLLAMLRLPDESATEWSADGSVARSGSQMSYSLFGFSVITVGAVAPDACPCFDEATMDEFDELAKGQPLHVFKSRPGNPLNPPGYGAALDVAADLSGGLLLGAFGGSGYCEEDLTLDGVHNPTRVESVTNAQAAACYALLRGRFLERSRTTLSVAAIAPGLPAGQSVEVELKITEPGGDTNTEQLTVTQGAAWEAEPGGHKTGTEVEAEIVAQPLAATCDVDPGPLPSTTESSAIEIVCESSGAECPCFNEAAISAARDKAVADGRFPGSTDTNDWAACAYDQACMDRMPQDSCWLNPNLVSHIVVGSSNSRAGSQDAYERIFSAGRSEGNDFCLVWSTQDETSSPTTITSDELGACLVELEKYRTSATDHSEWPDDNACYPFN